MFRAPRVRILGRRFDELLTRAAERRVEVFDEAGEVAWRSTTHPLLVALRRGRRVDGTVIGYRYGDRDARLGAGQRPGHRRTRRTGDRGGRLVQRHHRRQAVRLRAPPGGGVPPGPARHPRRGHRGLRRPGPDDHLQPGGPPAPRPRRDVEPIGRIPSSRMLRHPDGTPIEPEENPLLLAMSGRAAPQRRDHPGPARAASSARCSVNGQALVDEDGWKLGAVVAMHDVTEQKRNEERLADLAHHDPLTGLANRTLLAVRMREAVDALCDRPARPGRATGRRPRRPGPGPARAPGRRRVPARPRQLQGDQRRLRPRRRATTCWWRWPAGSPPSSVRPTPWPGSAATSSWWCARSRAARRRCCASPSRISAALARPYRIDGRTLVAEASVGGVFVDDPDTDPSKLLSLADDAMYGVKWSRRRQRRSMTD